MNRLLGCSTAWSSERIPVRNPFRNAGTAVMVCMVMVMVMMGPMRTILFLVKVRRVRYFVVMNRVRADVVHRVVDVVVMVATMALLAPVSPTSTLCVRVATLVRRRCL